jgi:hypothetical protein
MKTETHIQGDPLEQQIDVAAILLYTGETPEERRRAWDELLRLRALRTAERIEQMERERGRR